MINVTKTYLPPFEEYTAVLKSAWENVWVTNNGSLLKELEQQLRDYLQIQNLLICSNGTIVLQMALKALNITKEVITTPFSYVATTNAILWEGCKPVFADIRPDNFCIDAGKIESVITENTEAILATHVYGFACDVDRIEKIAAKYNLKVIYDAAHAFGCTYKGNSLLNFGDISTCSFHATKIFHTVEGGAIVCNNETLLKQLSLFRSFGHVHDDYFCMGVNAKNSELHAAMGLCMLPKIKSIISRRKELSALYDQKLNWHKIYKPFSAEKETHNYGYYPIVFATEEELLDVKQTLLKKEVGSRRYFYPSLNELPFVEYQPCIVSEAISRKVLALPMYYDLEVSDIGRICNIINSIV